MRLSVLDRGHRLRARLAIRVVPRVMGTALDDVALTSLYRPGLFGRPWLALVRQVMLGPSGWTRGERELLAAFVSYRNRCRYCVGIHTGTATILLGRPITSGLFDRWRSPDSGLTPRILTAFALLEGIGQDPAHIPETAVERAMAEGLSEDDIVDVLAVSFLFDLINRLADAFGYSFGDEQGRLAEAAALVRIAYKVPAVLLR